MNAGTVYLIHFSEPLKHARHYLGYTRDLPARMDQHRNGHGARLLQVIQQFGIEYDVVRTWPGSRVLERKLKDQHHTPRLCPICNPPGHMAATQEPNHVP